MHASAPLVSPPPSFSLSVRGRGAVLRGVVAIPLLGNSKMMERERTRAVFRWGCNFFGNTVTLSFYLVISVQSWAN
jgi:hypothetical protein